ncbi:SLC13 family permease [Cerasicoccus arenae]|uniref:Di-and tricarboxylate transporter n=1 Tax=Cerasicoccus arenae TaxID=424488 RepID=A0A8J3DH62_9BACT|nr:SLC13 family permease [Cerasicoccus arenae]MBK1857112.1 SLC13/DASS family transporter [Cerasicoccus arenae]GHB92435.1 di- and tricarboxylate transporter [Cerasicoccus arenae]
MSQSASSSTTESAGLRQRIGLILGPALFLLILLIPTPGGMSVDGQRVAAVAVLMAVWWISEAIPIPATSLLPIVLFPALRVLSAPQTTANYAYHLIFLFMGGFMIALAMQRWNLHRRIALFIIRYIGFSPGRLVLGFMVATGALSAFVSNTATAVMMMPIALAIITQAKDEIDSMHLNVPVKALDAFGVNMMLGIAYAASIGGIATLIGTPPNTVLAAYLANTYHYEISFVKWMIVGVPLAVIFIPLTWLWLTRIANPMKGLELPNSDGIIRDELSKLGPMGKGERWTLIIFLSTALAWITRAWVVNWFPVLNMINDASIAMAGAIALFLIPTNFGKREFVLNWEWANKLPWGVLVLFGGGLALAQGFDVSGLAAWTVDQLQFLSSMPIIIIILGLTALVTFLTEMTSNTATTTLLMPVLAGLAIGMGQSPLLLLAPAAISASCAFMLPVATPPNAIVFGSGKVTIPEMVRSGFALNVMGIFLVTLLTYLILIPVFGIVLGELPEWAK